MPVNCIEVARRCGADLRQDPNDWYTCKCPRPSHDDTEPSLRIHPSGEYFRCMGCHEGGGPEKLAQWFTGKGFARQIVYGTDDDVEVLRQVFEENSNEEPNRIDAGPMLLAIALAKGVGGENIDDALESDDPTIELRKLVNRGGR